VMVGGGGGGGWDRPSCAQVPKIEETDKEGKGDLTKRGRLLPRALKRGKGKGKKTGKLSIGDEQQNSQAEGGDGEGGGNRLTKTLYVSTV